MLRLFTDTDVEDREREGVGDREDRSPFGGSVEFGDDDPIDSDHLIKRFGLRDGGGALGSIEDEDFTVW